MAGQSEDTEEEHDRQPGCDERRLALALRQRQPRSEERAGKERVAGKHHCHGSPRRSANSAKGDISAQTSWLRLALATRALAGIEGGVARLVVLAIVLVDLFRVFARRSMEAI